MLQNRPHLFLRDTLRRSKLHRLGKVRLSIRAQNHLGQLKHRTGIPINVLARFGMCLSLKDESIPNPDMYDEKGMELLPHILFGKNEIIFSALFEQRLRDDGLQYDIYAERMIRAHINRGAGMLFPRIDRLSDFAKLLETEVQ